MTPARRRLDATPASSAFMSRRAAVASLRPYVRRLHPAEEIVQPVHISKKVENELPGLKDVLLRNEGHGDDHADSVSEEGVGSVSGL